MNLKKNNQSLSFISYSLDALSLLLLYNGFSTLYANLVADFIIGEKQNVLIFQFSYGSATALIFIGSLLFFSVRYIISRLEQKKIISPDNAIRFWILGGVILVTTLFAVFDLFTLLSGVLTGRYDIISLLVTSVTLTTLAMVFLYCIIEIRRKETLRSFSFPSLIFRAFCIFSFVVGFLIAPPWTGREAYLDQEQLGRMRTIKYALDKTYLDQKNLPSKLEDLHSEFVKSRLDIQDVNTEQPYEYKKISASSYELCGQFLTDYDVYRRFQRYNDELIQGQPHQKGRTCYVIDLSLKDPRVSASHYAD